jgi:hypothetical protein
MFNCAIRAYFIVTFIIMQHIRFNAVGAVVIVNTFIAVDAAFITCVSVFITIIPAWTCAYAMTIALVIEVL